MKDDIFALVKKKIRDAGTTDPREIAIYHNIMVIDLKGSIAGYASLYKNIVPVIGLNVRLSGFWYLFGGYHELTHVFHDDIRHPGFTNGHMDSRYAQKEVDDRSIPRHEKVANLVAADLTVPDDRVIEITGYDNPGMQSYRRLKTYQYKLIQELENLRCSFDFSNPGTLLKTQAQTLCKKIRGVSETISEMELEMVYSNCRRTFSEMAAELGITERILRYKLEAMRLQGMDIDRQELEQYSNMFDGAI